MKPPKFTAAGENTSASIIENNGFFPDVQIQDFKKRYRLDDDVVPEERIIQALITSMTTTHQDLGGWVCEQTKKGYLKLLKVPADVIGGCHELQHHYNTAIYARAKASLIEQYPDYDTTKSGHDRAEALKTTVDDYMEEHFTAIRKLQRKPRCIIEAL